jgi:hypothetical protein
MPRAANAGGMRPEVIWDAGAARRYDTPGPGMFAPEILGPAVDRLAELAGDGRRISRVRVPDPAGPTSAHIPQRPPDSLQEEATRGRSRGSPVSTSVTSYPSAIKTS